MLRVQGGLRHGAPPARQVLLVDKQSARPPPPPLPFCRERFININNFLVFVIYERIHLDELMRRRRLISRLCLLLLLFLLLHLLLCFSSTAFSHYCYHLLIFVGLFSEGIRLCSMIPPSPLPPLLLVLPSTFAGSPVPPPTLPPSPALFLSLFPLRVITESNPFHCMSV